MEAALELRNRERLQECGGACHDHPELLCVYRLVGSCESPGRTGVGGRTVEKASDFPVNTQVPLNRMLVEIQTGGAIRVRPQKQKGDVRLGEEGM